MPYKDSERKRQWEQDHREERNASRREQRLRTPVFFLTLRICSQRTGERPLQGALHPFVPRFPQRAWQMPRQLKGRSGTKLSRSGE